MSTKPLIFIYPLSETMKKLKEVIEEISEDEGIEIYEVDELAEIAQLIPTIGQSLSIYGAPKKCAMALKQLRKVNLKLNSKALLINEKAIPRKTLDKFSKIGLTEFIQEPVAAKTLLYKVKLQLKSIVVDDGEEEEEVGVKSTGEMAAEEDQGIYNSKKKEAKEEEDDLDYLTKKKIKKELEIEEVENKKNKSNYQEEEIDNHWQGKLTKEELSLDDVEEPEDTPKKEESIDNYLRGKQDLSESIEEESKKKKNKYKDEIDENFSGKNNTDIIEEERSVGKIKKDIEAFDEEELDDIQNNNDSTSAYYKGKVKKEEIEEEDESKEKSKGSITVLNIEDDKNLSLDNEEEEEEILRKKKKNTLEIEEVDEKEMTQEQLDEEELGRKKRSKNLLEIDEDKPPSEGLVDHIENKENSGEGSTDKIDKYLRGGSAAREEEFDEDGAKKDKSLEIDITAQEVELEIDISNEEDDSKEKDLKRDHHLEIEDKPLDKNKEDGTQDEEDYLEKKKAVELDIESKDREIEDSSLDDERGILSKSEKSSIVEKEEREKRKSLEEVEKEKKKTHESTVDNLTQEKLKAQSRVDKIKTHYSSESSTSHIDDDWNFTKSDKKQIEEKLTKEDNEDILSYLEKVDLGEQTIDYRKLKDEFGGFTTDREGNNVKNTGPKYYGGGRAEKAKAPTYYRDDEETSKENIVELEEQSEESYQDQIFEPHSMGLENIIKVLNFYNLDKDAQDQAYKYVCKIIQSNFEGEMALFYYDEKKSRVSEATNSLPLLGPIDLSLKQPIWDKLFSKNYRTWKENKLPTWTDITFQEKDIQFIYPYYEGASLMGFAITWFMEGFDEKRSAELEVTLETLRGFLIANFREGQSSGQYSGTKKKAEEIKNNPIKSLFGKLFKKKAS